jgi:hypothetical protein
MEPNNANGKYPDISDILMRKALGKREASKRSFAEKIAIVEALNERLAPLKAMREARKREKDTEEVEQM